MIGHTPQTGHFCRPHFLDVCQPDITFDVEHCGSQDSPLYVTEYACKGNLMFDEAEREDRNKVTQS